VPQAQPEAGLVKSSWERARPAGAAKDCRQVMPVSALTHIPAAEPAGAASATKVPMLGAARSCRPPGSVGEAIRCQDAPPSAVESSAAPPTA